MASTTTVAATHAVDAATRDRIEAASDDHAVHHHHGDMEIKAQEKTYAGFISVLVWSVVGIALILIFLALANT